MSILSILSTVLSPIEKIIDDVTTTDEERMEAKAKLKDIMLNADAKAAEEITKRWAIDTKANALTKSIRPIILLFLTGVLFVLSFMDGNIGEFVVNPEYIDTYRTLLLMVYGAYFVGRSVEKMKKGE